MNHRIFTAALAAAGLLWGGTAARAADYPDWEGYSPLFSMNGVAGFGGMVYGATDGGIFRYDPDLGTYTLYFKNHGLPANDARCVTATSDRLYFGFGSAGLLEYDPAADRFEQILFPEYVPNKIALRSLFAQNDSILYVGHSAGIDILNLRTREVRTINRLGELAEDTPVNDVKVINGKIMACTSLGLSVADENNPNLEIESSWKTYTYQYWSTYTGFNCIIHVLDEAEDRIYLGTNERGIVWFDEAAGRFWESAASEGTVYAMCPGMEKYWAASSLGLYSKFVKLWSLKDESYLALTGVWSDGSRVWVATRKNGLQCWTDKGWADVAPVPGPRSTKFARIGITDTNVVWATTSFLKSRRQEEDKEVFHRFQNGEWTTYPQSDGFYRTPVSVALDKDRAVWLAMWGSNPSGMFLIRDDGTPDKKDDEIIEVDPEKKYFRPTIKTYYIVCSDVTTDKAGNIWVSNFQLDQPDVEEGGYQHTLEPVPTSGMVVVDGYPITKYRAFSPASGDIVTAKIYDICADDDGWVWMGTDKKGLMGLYVGADPFDTSTAPVRQHLMTAEGLNSLRVTAIRHDREGYIWVGTDAGLNRVTKFPDHRVKVDVMTQLLGTAGTVVNGIDVDRFNNKWVATTNGLVKISPDNVTAAVYTTANSGLFSNTILGLTYDNRTDILWIGTDAGMNTFRVFGSDSPDTAQPVRVYPNPFPVWGSDSRCTFDNLASGSKLRIFAFDGTPVVELTVTESTAKGVSYVTWNGRNYKNGYVGSGVYFFAGVDKNGRAFRDKMVVIRR